MADIARVHTRERLRRSAETCVILGLCLMAVAAVAQAEDPTPTPIAVAVEATATPTPAPLATVIPTPTPDLTPVPTATAEPTATVEPTPTATATAAATATATPPVVVGARPQPDRGPRQGATPTPTPSPTPQTPDEFTGAALTLCHATGDPVGPYVSVTVDANGFDDHFDHDADIIPAPPEGCASIDPDAAGERPVRVCHATGDSERPYVLTRPFAVDDLEGHEGHQGDLIPAPNDTCPGVDPYAVPTPTPTATPEPEPTRTEAPAPPLSPTRPPDGDGGDEGDEAGGGVQGDDAGGPTAVTVESGANPAQQLPFTGFDLWLIASAGLGLALTGAGLRVLAAQPPVGVTR